MRLIAPNPIGAETVQLEKTARLISNIHGDIRRIAHNLLPVTLAREGLVSALFEFVGEINQLDMLEIKINNQLSADFRLPKRNELELRNGVDSLIASTTLPTDRLSQVRVILGDNNSFVINGTEIPFNVPSGQKSGMKFNVQQELAPDGSYTVWTDFDVAKSIVETGNGGYAVKPVIRVFTELTNGRIKGMVSPISPESSVIVTAISATDTATAIWKRVRRSNSALSLTSVPLHWIRQQQKKKKSRYLRKRNKSIEGAV